MSLKLIPLGFWVRFQNLWESIQVLFYYPKFRRFYLGFLGSYLCTNPYRVANSFSQGRGEDDIYTYGETPIRTLAKICQVAEISSGDTVYELGAGRALSCFWLHYIIGAKVIGIEYNPFFIDKARALARRFNVQGVHFVEGDIFQQDYSLASIVYFYGTCTQDPELRILADRLSTMPKGSTLITVSFPIIHYQKKKTFQVWKVFHAEFTWGQAQVFCQKKI